MQNRHNFEDKWSFSRHYSYSCRLLKEYFSCDSEQLQFALLLHQELFYQTPIRIPNIPKRTRFCQKHSLDFIKHSKNTVENVKFTEKCCPNILILINYLMGRDVCGAVLVEIIRFIEPSIFFRFPSFCSACYFQSVRQLNGWNIHLLNSYYNRRISSIVAICALIKCALIKFIKIDSHSNIVSRAITDKLNRSE